MDLKPKPPHFAPKATAMISMFMHGGPSHVDLLDPKPELTKHHGTEYGGDVVYSFVNRANKKLFGTPWKFAKQGQCGTEVSELLPGDRRHRGRHLRGPLDAHGAQRPRGLDPILPRRDRRHRRPADDGELDRLRPRQPVAGPAGLHGPLRPRRAPGRRHDQLVERIHAAALSGDGPPAGRAADPQPRPAAASARAIAGAEPRVPGPSQPAPPAISIRARPTSRPGSRATSWPRPCRRPPRRRSTSRASPSRSDGSTDSTRTTRGSTARAA